MNVALKKGIALVLCLLFLLPLTVGLPALAAEDGTRFIFTSLRVNDKTAFGVASSPVSLPLSGSTVQFAVGGLSPVCEGANALYISLVNTSTASAIAISYTYEENGEAKTYQTSAAIVPGQAAAQTLSLPVVHFDKNASGLLLTFSGEGELSGIVTLNCCFDMVTYLPEQYLDHQGDPLATLTSCYYDEQEETVEITGKISHATSAAYPRENYYLALFTLSAGEELYLSRKTPLQRSEMALDFSFSVKLEDSDGLFVRYVVAAVDRRQGASIPLCAPVYPDAYVGVGAPESAFKGFHTQNVCTLMDVTPGVEIVDVYLNRLQATQTSGLLYVGEHSYYYFDEKYVSELDHRIRNLCGIGTHVYLRFLIDPDANHVAFADYCAAESGVINKMPAVRDEQGKRDLVAITDFLTRRYTDDSIGRISGIVLGRSVNRSSTHSFADVDDLSEYAMLCATSMHLIATAARRNHAELSMVIPLSDRIFGDAYDEHIARGDYYTALFLPALLQALDVQVLEGQGFSLMLESCEIPARLATSGGDGYGTDRLDDFFAFLAPFIKRHHALSTDIFYAWEPDAMLSTETLKAAYLLQYLTLYRNDRVQSFLVDLSLTDAAEDERGAEALSFLARYIDTDKLPMAAASALHTLGVSGIEELFSDLSASALQVRSVRTHVLTLGEYDGEAVVSGSYRMWDFGVATTSLDWYAGAGCKELSVTSDAAVGRALMAELFANAAYGEVVYDFGRTVDISFAPLIAMELAVEGSEGMRYELQLRLLGESDTVIASAIVGADGPQRLCLDLREYSNTLSQLRAIRITARPLDAGAEDFHLSLYTFDWESATLSNAELAQRVNAIRESNTALDNQQAQKRDITLPLVTSAVVLLASIAVVVLVLSRHYTKKRRTNHTEEG